MPVRQILGWTNTRSLVRESVGRASVPNEGLSDEPDYLMRRAKSCTGETRDGGISTPVRKSCSIQRSRPRISGGGKEWNGTRVSCARLCTWSSQFHGWPLTLPTEGSRGGVGEEMGDEFAADGFAQRVEVMPRRGIGNSRRPYRLNSDNKPHLRKTTRRGLVSKTFLSALSRRKRGFGKSNVKLEERAPAVRYLGRHHHPPRGSRSSATLFPVIPLVLLNLSYPSPPSLHHPHNSQRPLR